MSMIRTKEIDLELDGKPVLRGISLNIERGSKVAVFGESGSGKTSLMRALIGLHRPTSGSIEVGGHVMVPENLPKIRRQVFYMPQEVRPIFEETVREFIDAFFAFKVTRDSRPTDDGILKVFDSLRLHRSLLNARMSTLSGGERQRVGLARGLLLNRELMLLDEVTSAVDSDNKSSIVDLLLELKETTVVAVTHDPKLVERADTRVEMRSGRVV